MRFLVLTAAQADAVRGEYNGSRLEPREVSGQYILNPSVLNDSAFDSIREDLSGLPHKEVTLPEPEE